MTTENLGIAHVPAEQQLRSQTSAWLSVREAAAHCNVSTTTIYQAAQVGDLIGSKVGRGLKRSHWRFNVANLDRWMAGERG